MTFRYELNKLEIYRFSEQVRLGMGCRLVERVRKSIKVVF